MPAESRAARACVAAALALTLAWGLAYIFFARGDLCDESGHLGVMFHFAEKKPGWPEQLTTPPGYQLLTVWVSRGHPSYTWARAVSLGFALLGVVAFAGTWSKIHGRPTTTPVLLYALLPILEPYAGMAYNDVPALALLLAAAWAHFSRQRLLGAALLAVSLLVRQTNIIWAAFLVAYEALLVLGPATEREENLSATVTLWRRTRGLWFVLAATVTVILAAGRLTPGTQHGNTLAPNIATLHFAGVLALLLGLPVWLWYTPASLRRLSAAWTGRPFFSATLTALALVIAAGLAFTFANPHGWNRDLFWEGCRFTLLRNWPLVYLDHHAWLRAASGLNLVALAVAVWWVIPRQRFSAALWLNFACSIALLASNFLVEPRYFIVPTVFTLLFLEVPSRESQMLVGWFALLCAVHAPFIVANLSLW